jgi:CRISPR type IV-associated protein Csf3
VTFELRTPAGYVPMRIIARMDEPIGYLGDLLHLDGPIAYGVYHDLDEHTRRTIEPIEITEFPVDFRSITPLSTWWVSYDPEQHGAVDARLLSRQRRRDDPLDPQLWGWCCSAADESSWARRSKLEIRKKPDLARMARYTDARTANLSSGHMKAYDLTVPTVFAREVTWFAHGDVDKIRHLLAAYVPALGKKRNIGGGTVREWIVREEPGARDDLAIIQDGRLMRRMPAGAATGEAVRAGAIRPPYYHHTRVVICEEPC